jgi:DNA-directed RNA polymerase subunit omega
VDIIKLPIEHTDESIDSRFRLVLMAAQRARQISDGSDVMVRSKYVKNTTLALEEAIEGKLKYLTGDEARKAREYEFRTRREKLARESMEEGAAASLERIEDIKAMYKSETAIVELEKGAAKDEEAEDEELPEEDELDEED